jgi:hypothetical protein
MELNQPTKMPGVIEGVYYGQNERVDEINTRYQERQFSDSPLEPNFSPRPVPTKYAIFPMMNHRKEAKEFIIPYPEYRTEHIFNPGTANAPPSGYYANIDVETQLRFQNVALQRRTDQGIYVPSSNSDLYKVSVIARPEVQPNPLLFERYDLDQSAHPNNVTTDIGRDLFYNHTRTQLRGISE